MAAKKAGKSTVRRLRGARDGVRREPRTDDFVLNLDSIEKERTAGVFSIEIDGRQVEFLDASDVDWRDLINLGSVGDPYTWLESIMSDEDFQWILGQSFEGWKLERILREYQEHYGVDAAPNASGSRTS